MSDLMLIATCNKSGHILQQKCHNLSSTFQTDPFKLEIKLKMEFIHKCEFVITLKDLC